jgi:hypothetical protein
MQKPSDSYQDIRNAVRDLCAQYPAEYFRKLDMERACPEAFVEALGSSGRELPVTCVAACEVGIRGSSAADTPWFVADLELQQAILAEAGRS